MTKKAFISAANYYKLCVRYSGKRKVYFVSSEKQSITIGKFMVDTGENFYDVMAKHTEGIFNTYKTEREKIKSIAPNGSPNTPPNGSNGKNNVILVILILIGIVLYSVLVDSLLKLICK